MSNDLGAATIKPALEDAVAVSHKKQQKRYVQVSGNAMKQPSASSLVARCRAVVVANLERYPPEMIGMLSEDDWEDIVRCKHRKTAPQKGSGGLDGTGRRTPALSEKFLSEVESQNGHLSESSAADELIWKDCVEYRFTRGGLTRPRALLVPWPLLVNQIADLSNLLQDWKKREDEVDASGEQLELTEQEAKTIVDATLTLKESPMNLVLLKESGIGKVLKKLIKASSSRSYKSIFKRLKMPVSGGVPAAARTAGDSPGKELSVLKQLERLLQAWMDFAASKGVEIQSSGSGNKKKTKLSETTEQFQKDDEDLRRVEGCMSWRQLFTTLKERTEQRRLNLGLKMRENRKKENSQRPQIVKVRPASRRREAMLQQKGASAYTWGRGGGDIDKDGGAKILQLRKEAAVQAARQKSGLPNLERQSGFGAAVAFAANSRLTPMQKMQRQQMNKRKASPTIVPLGGGKRMAVPHRAVRMQGTVIKKSTGNSNKPAANSRRRK